jgi:aspartate aminotransferase-like enzyme
MIAVSARARDAWPSATMARHYFDLEEARRYADKGETPWTPAVSVLFQLDVALDLLAAEGYAQIYARHAACAAAARAGLAALGFRLLADPAHASDTVTSAWLPDGVDWSAFNRQLLDRGLVLAGGQGKLAGKIMRVGHLGAVTPAEIVAAIEIIEQGCQALGIEIEPGAGSRAAAAALGQPERVAIEA